MRTIRRPRFRLWQLMALVALAAVASAVVVWSRSPTVPTYYGRVDANSY